MSDVALLSAISGLSFDSPFLSPLLFFLPSPLSPSCLESLMVHAPDFFFQKTRYGLRFFVWLLLSS